MESSDMKRNRQNGFTLFEMLVVVSIIAILTAIAIPVIHTVLDKTKEVACQANRRSLCAQLAVRRLMDGLDSLEEAVTAYEEDGIDVIAPCVCPSGGVISVAGNTITCSIHGGVEETQTDRLSAMLSLFGSDNLTWHQVLRDHSDFDFPAVDAQILTDYKTLLGNKDSFDEHINVNLTWKPAVTNTGSCVMIASSDDRDQTAMDNALANKTWGGYDALAYIIFDGSDYYVHAHFGKPNPSWVSDNSLNLDTIYADEQWKKLYD
jgi:prepilin-type N-terminal cleavage/methylation domain-containing protein